MIRKGNKDEINSIIKLIDKVFHKNFKKLIPKFYNIENERRAKYTAESHFILEDNNKITGTVGSFDNTYFLGNDSLKISGIGMVAVHKMARGKGYMNILMKEAVNEAKNNGVDFMFLSGNRQRYERYGFVPCGEKIVFDFYKFNLPYIKGSKIYTFGKIKNDFLKMDALYNIYKAQDCRSQRNIENFYHILTTWKFNPYVIFDGEDIIGYIVLNTRKKTIEEIIVLNEYVNDLSCIASTFMQNKKYRKLHVIVSSNKQTYVQSFTKFANNFTKDYTGYYNILNYANTVEKLLKYKEKSNNIKLQNGSLTVEITEYSTNKIKSVFKINVNEHITCENLALDQNYNADIKLSECEAGMAMFSNLPLIYTQNQLFSSWFNGICLNIPASDFV